MVNGGGVIKNKLTFFRDFSTERGFWYSPTDSLSLNQWQHVVVTYNEDSTSNDPILYINGVSQSILWDDLPSGTPSDDSAQSLHIGKFAGANSRNFDGIIDELHISTIERSADWIITEYNNQLDPISFSSISSEETQNNWSQADFRYRKQITIDNNQVNSPSPLTDFPLLIDIYDTDLRDKTQPDGDDIIFTDITGTKLDHELELYDQMFNDSFTHLVAWVRIPTLHATIDTELFLYYGNLNTGSTENPTGVWDSNYKGVWHLSEDPTATAPQFKDSTTNTNHGTSNNLVSNDQITGQIDGALNFTDLDSDYINIGDQSSLNMGSGEFSLELWFNYDGSDKGPLAGKGSYGSNGIRYYLAIETTEGVIKAEIDDDGAGGKEIITTGLVTYADSMWHQAMMVRDGNYLRLYIDGLEVSDSPKDITGYGNLDRALPFYINTLASDTGGSLTDWSNVKMDEVRVSNIARSSNWIETGFTNQDNPSNFYTINSEENQSNWFEYPGIVEWVAGDSENSATVTTNKSILGVSNQLYIAAVSVKNYADTTSVSGLGLTWIELEDQPGGRSQTGISVWYAIGQSPTTGTVTATVSSAPKASVIQVFRIANVNPSNPIGDQESANTNGENGAGSGGVDDTYAYLDIITTSDDVTVLGLIGQRGRITTAGAGYSVIAENTAGSSGDIAGLTSEYKFVPSAGTVVVNSTFNIDTDWAIVGLEINPFLESGDFIPPEVNDFGVEDSGTGTGIFWANVTDDNAVNSVTLKLNSTNYGMTYNDSLWIYQTAINFLDYFTYQIINASDSSNNDILSPSSENNYTFNLDNTLPTVIDWIYDNTIGYNGTFRTNVSDSWGIIDTVYVTVTSCQCVSSNTAIMQLNGNEYINDTILMKSGSIFFEITVNDTANNNYTSTLQSGTVINKAPSTSNLTFSPSTVTSNDSLTLNYDFFDIDDDTESGTEIRWYNNSVLQSTFNDLTTIPLSDLYKGDQWYATVKPKDGALFGSLVTSSVIIIENTLPLASNVIINPSSAFNTTTLTVSYSYSDIDSDTENIANREIRWYKNGIWESPYDNSLTLPNTATTKGETWNFRIRVHDGFNYSLWVNSTTVEIKNSAPTASNLEILNPTPKTTDDLIANWTYNDIDLDPENPSWIILWYRNDILQGTFNNSKTLSSGYTNKTDVWYFKLQVHDGTNYSILYQSPNVQVVNTAPSASNIDITQNPYTTDDLVASWTFNDVDGDAQSGILNITWYKNGTYQSAYNNLTTILSSETTKGETWIYLFQVYDGESFSVSYNSSDYGMEAFILNSAPTTSNEVIVNQNPYTTNNLVASWDEADNDGVSDIESGIVNITWYKSGIQVSIYNNKTQVNSTDTQKGEQWNFIIQIYDGETFSIPENSSYVTILNSLPTASDRKFNTSSVTKDDDFNISYVFSDADGDLEVTSSLIVYWFINGTYYSSYDNQTVIYSSNTTEGSFYYYIIRVYDGSHYSDNLTSIEGMVIGFGSSNTEPEASNLAITPLNPTTTDNLIASYTFYDDNGNQEFGSEIRWYKNGFLQSTLNDSLIVSSTFTSKGENWYFTVKPKDGLDFGLVNISSNITIRNTAPTAFGLGLTQNPVTTQNLIANWDFTDVDGDLESGLYNITWYRNGIYLSQFDNQTQINSDYTNKSENWYFVVQVYDGENYSISYNSSTTGQVANVVNSIPTALSLRFNNTFPRTNEPINANWTFADADDDLEVASWIILWYKSNVLQPSLNNSRIINSTSKNQVWFFKLQVYDGENYSIVYQSPTIQILNTAPTVSNISITSSPQTDDDLDASWMFQDVDGDSASVIINLTWYKDGIHQSSFNNISVVPSSSTSKGEIWDYLVQVFDGEIFSVLYNSSESGVFAVILNSVPVASNLIIQNPNPYTTNDLESDWTYYDADGDVQSGIINITWFRNGIHISSYDNETTLPANATIKGEQWKFKLQVYDGESFSIAQNSSLVTIINSIPKISSTPTFNKTAGIKTIDDIEISYIYSDADNDINSLVNLNVVWFLFGFEFVAKENQTILYASETSKGQFWTYRIQVFDGEAYSIVYTSTIIQIENSVPEVQGALVVTPNNPTPGDTLVLSYIWTDPDNSDFERDTEVRWYKNNILQNFDDSLTVEGVYIIKGDIWNVTVRVSDGTDYGYLVFYSVFIGNSIPEILTSNINPITAITSTPLFVNLSFSREITFYDDDSDPIVWIEYKWFIDGVENSTFYNQTSIPASATVKGQVWMFSLQISDGIDFSLLFNSS
ncbi:MAG: LamG-like jellyroll fold domain-containing protein, partial [Candidatus Kariarchaeaceae archaeon]